MHLPLAARSIGGQAALALHRLREDDFLVRQLPVVSFVLLGGRCRYCRARISFRYPVVELGTGLLFFYWVSAHGVTALAIKMCVFSALLVGLVFSDLEERILPDEMTLGGVLLGLGFAWFVKVDDFSGMALLWLVGLQPPERFHSPIEAAMGAALPAFFLWGGGWLYEKIRHREGLGLGDVKLIAMVGAFLGLHSALLTLILGSIAGSVVGYAYIRWRHKDASTYELPFGTFLGLAALVAGFGQGLF